MLLDDASLDDALDVKFAAMFGADIAFDHTLEKRTSTELEIACNDAVDVRDGAGFHDQRSLDNAVKIELDAALDYDVSFTTPRIVTSELTVRSPLSTADRSKGRAEAEAALAG